MNGQDNRLTNTADQIRTKVLEDVRRSIGLLEPAAKTSVEERYRQIQTKTPPQPVVDGTLTDRFVEKLTRVHGGVSFVNSYSAVPEAVRTFLSGHNLPQTMVMSAGGLMREIDWASGWTIEERSANAEDQVSITDALCAIAESGTLVFASSSSVSSTHMFLPENHIVVLNEGQIVRHHEDAVKVCSSHIEKESRAVHMITGPSKTADVEQTIQYGAHGPRRLHVVLIRTH